MAVSGISPVEKKEKKNKFETFMNLAETGIGIGSMIQGMKGPKAGMSMGQEKKGIDFGVDTDLVSKFAKRKSWQ